jgi:hypothetical protein
MVKHTLFTWLFTCVAGTMILAAYFGLEEGSFKSSEMELLVLIALGITLVASIPAMIVYGLLTNSLLRSMEPAKAKAIGSGYALLATLLTCILTVGIISGGSLHDGGGIALLASSPYAVCFAAAVWIIPMPPKERTYDIPEGDAAEAPLYPAAPPPAYYIIAGIAGIILLYSMSNMFMGGLRMRGAWTSSTVIWFFVHTGLAAAGLFLFIQWKAIGWKLLVLLSAGGLLGGALSLAYSFRMMIGQGMGMISGYLGSLALFMLVDALSLYLLSLPALRERYGAGMKDYWLWIAAGAGYAVLRTVLMQMIYGM